MLDDDKPDYFINEEDKPAASQPETGGKTIDFAPGQTDVATSQEPKKHHHRFRKVVTWTIIIGVVVLGVAFYLRYCSPYAEDAVMRVYVVNVEKRGIIFKTFEAQAVSAEALADTSQVYSHPEQFSIENEALAMKLQSYQGQKIPVTLHYEKYYATLPWRGASKWVVTGVN
ncbi:MAG: hypothetical protein NC338_04950 [Firmicutes bacterium]|nr:hypothetical protein [Bacillota bacterium]MCM1476362.1 hypothetical protein [Bacteroides sp.]